MTLPGNDPNGNPLTFRIISQPRNGSVGVSNSTATYFAEAGYTGSDSFTFAANDTYSDSNLGTGIVSVAQGPFSFGLVAHAPTNAAASWPVAFAAVPSVTNHTGAVSFNWNFGDGSPASTNQFPTHAYPSGGNYAWSVTATLSNLTASANGSIRITGPIALTPPLVQGSALNFSWPASSGDVVVEQSDMLGAGAKWTAVTNPPVTGPAGSTVLIPVADGDCFFRVRQAW
jgi:PKD repeat protein